MSWTVVVSALPQVSIQKTLSKLNKRQVLSSFFTQSLLCICFGCPRWKTLGAKYLQKIFWSTSRHGKGLIGFCFRLISCQRLPWEACLTYCILCPLEKASRNTMSQGLPKILGPAFLLLKSPIQVLHSTFFIYLYIFKFRGVNPPEVFIEACKKICNPLREHF